MKLLIIALLLNTNALTLLNKCSTPKDLKHLVTPEEWEQIPVLITKEAEISKHVGQVVRLEGTVENSKIPTLLGVDVSCDSIDVRGMRAWAEGILKKEVVEAKDVDPYSAGRGEGTYYYLENPLKGRLAYALPLD